MKERRYKEDWVNKTRFDENGKEKRVPVYRGPLFSLPSGQDKRKLLLSALLPWAVYLVLLLLYFRLDFPGARVLYVFLPAALGLFPCVYWAMGIWGVYRAPDRMTRLQKENGIGRVLRSAAGCTFCAAAALVGEAVFLILSGNASREWPGALMLAASAAMAFTAASRYRTLHRQLPEERSTSL